MCISHIKGFRAFSSTIKSQNVKFVAFLRGERGVQVAAAISMQDTASKSPKNLYVANT